ncbi:MAG: long-chain-acyl-CoA synthetase [Myxococcales bacterium]|nr:long-chain-acyl-CoA synthetase [Myxococcales bacterium]
MAPSHPSPTSFAARRAQLAGLARLAACIPLFRPGATWTTARLLARNARRDPDGLALAFEERRYAWSEMDREVDRYAAAFERLGVGPGDAVALLVDNRPEYVFAMTALARLRATSALVNTGISGAGLAHAVRVGRPRKVVVGVEHEAKLLDALGDVDGLARDDVLSLADPGHDARSALASFDALVAARGSERPRATPDGDVSQHFTYIYTSGTTGLPKAAIITHARMLTASSLFGRAIFEAGPGDVIYCALPLYHSSAMFAGLGASLVTGAGLALRRKFSASRFWDDVRAFGATRFVYIGELCRYLLNQPAHPGERDHRLRIATGNGLRPDIWERFQERFAIPLVREFYGATEGVAPTVNFAGIPGMVGRLMPGQVVLRCDPETGEVARDGAGRCARARPGETGLLAMRIGGIAKFDGYLDEKASRKKVLADVLAPGDRYFDSGDLVALHGGGWISFADRIGDTFRWKGENVSTNEVAEALNRAKGVLEANVYGVEVPGAEGRAGMASLHVDEAFSIQGFADHVVHALPVYQRPYFVRLQRDMRITGTFKHQKVDYRREGYDPSRTSDPLYFLDADAYVPLDARLFDSIQRGETTLR